MEYRIETFGEVDQLRPVGEALADYLEELELVLKVARAEEPTDEELERLEDTGLVLGFRDDLPHEHLEGDVLEVRAHPSRIELVLTIGGPHVELDVLRDVPREKVEEVTLRRYWGGEADRAWTTDYRACELVGDYLATVGLEELALTE